ELLLSVCSPVLGDLAGRSLSGALGISGPWRDILWPVRISQSVRGGGSHAGRRAASEAGPPHTGTGSALTLSRPAPCRHPTTGGCPSEPRPAGPRGASPGGRAAVDEHARRRDLEGAGRPRG